MKTINIWPKGKLGNIRFYLEEGGSIQIWKLNFAELDLYLVLH